MDHRPGAEAIEIADEMARLGLSLELSCVSVRSADSLHSSGFGASADRLRVSDLVELELSGFSSMLAEAVSAIESESQEDFVRTCLSAMRTGGATLPGLETLIHGSIPRRYVATVHSAGVDAVVCGEDAGDCGEDAVWIPNGGGITALFAALTEAADAVAAGTGAALLFVQNVGLVIGSNDRAELTDSVKLAHDATSKLVAKLADTENEATVIAHTASDDHYIRAVVPYLRGCTHDGNRAHFLRLICDRHAREFATDLCDSPDETFPLRTYREIFGGVSGMVLRTPDIDLQLSPSAIAAQYGDSWRQAYEAFCRSDAEPPQVVAIEGVGVAVSAPTYAGAENLRRAVVDGLMARETLRKRTGDSGKRLGQPSPFAKQLRGAHRMLASAAERLSAGSVAPVETDGLVRSDAVLGKVCVVTGGARGYGERLVRNLAASGALVFVVDLNEAGARQLSDEINEHESRTAAIPIAANVADEGSIAAMIDTIIRSAGGLDLFISNAGVVRTGSVKEIAQGDLEFVSSVNYTGYFLCVKHCALLLEIQNAPTGRYFTDIVQINSKSGLEGSNKNAPYSGSKFGGIGLTQSFALELIEDNIKVNSICPGNYFDGPLWSDPEKGLFVQYLSAGKVPGAKTTDDVRRFYESKVPMKRGCSGEDVIRAVYYVVQQKYETGQAIPVTGGQIMLK